MENQNLRVFARRLNTEIDETYVNVVMGKVERKPQYWLGRTGAFTLAIANVFFKKGVKGSDAFNLGNIAGSVFWMINHSETAMHIPTTVIAETAKQVGVHNVNLTRCNEISQLLADYYLARSAEKRRASVANVVLGKVR